MDPILYWNDVALEANRVDITSHGQQGGPTRSSRALGIVHLGMYDAWAGVRATAANPPYQSGLPPVPAGASAAAAVAGAAHATLAALFPAQLASFDAALAAAPLDAGVMVDGLTFGRAVAASLLAKRAGDPSASSAGYIYNPLPGHHRPDPLSGQPTELPHGAFYGASMLYASTKRYEIDPPPAQGTAAYNKSVRQVRQKGIAPEQAGRIPTNGLRTADETLAGIFWAFDGVRELGTPPRLYNQFVRQVAEAQINAMAGLSEEDRTDRYARLFALVNAAMADAGVLAWAEKYRYDLWRPVIGVREHDPSMGEVPGAPGQVGAECDPTWLPLGAPKSNEPRDPVTNDFAHNFTPPFPAYPSGHATFGAAAFHMTRMFFGVSSGDRSPDTLAAGLGFVSGECDGVTRDNRGVVRPRHLRSFPDGLWEMIKENSLSRVYLGVHWNFDGFTPDSSGEIDASTNVGGVPLGLAIAEDIFNSGMVESAV